MVLVVMVLMMMMMTVVTVMGTVALMFTGVVAMPVVMMKNLTHLVTSCNYHRSLKSERADSIPLDMWPQDTGTTGGLKERQSTKTLEQFRNGVPQG